MTICLRTLNYVYLCVCMCGLKNTLHKLTLGYVSVFVCVFLHAGLLSQTDEHMQAHTHTCMHTQAV